MDLLTLAYHSWHFPGLKPYVHPYVGWVYIFKSVEGHWKIFLEKNTRKNIGCIYVLIYISHTVNRGTVVLDFDILLAFFSYECIKGKLANL